MKKLLKVFVAIVFLFFAGLTVFFFMFDINKYKGKIESAATNALGRPVTIEKADLKISLIPTITLDGVRVANAEWSKTDKPLVKVDTMNVTFEFLPLLSGKFNMKEFQIGTAVVSLEKQGNFNNWTFKETKEAASSDAPKVKKQHKIMVDNVRLKLLTVYYHQDDQLQTGILSDLWIQQLKAVSGNLFFAGKSFHVAARLDNLLDLMEQKPNYSFNIQIGAFDAETTLSGTIGNVADFSDIYLNVMMKGNDIRQFLNQLTASKSFEKIPAENFDAQLILKGNLNQLAFDQSFIKINNGSAAQLDVEGRIQNMTDSPLITATGVWTVSDEKWSRLAGLNPFSVTFDMGFKNKELTVNQMVYAAGKSDVEIKANMSFVTEKPNMMATISSNYLNVHDVVAEMNDTSSTTTKSKSDTPKTLDLSVLKKMDGSLVVSLNNVDATDKLTNTLSLNLKTLLKDGVLTISPLSAKALGGTISGNITVDASGDMPYIETLLLAKGIQSDTIKPLATEVTGATVNAEVNLKAAGRTQKELLSSLTGTIMAEVLDGTIVSKVFNSLPATAAVLRNQVSAISFSTSDQVSKIICGALNIPVRKGVLDLNHRVALETSSVNFALTGEVDLANESMSVSLVPSVSALANKVNQALSLTQIVRISGPFNDLKPTIDAAAVTTGLAQAGINALLNQKPRVSQMAPYSLCEQALGRPFKQNQKVVKTPKPTQQQTPQPAPVPVKQQFQEQLLQSLTKALSQQ